MAYSNCSSHIQGSATKWCIPLRPWPAISVLNLCTWWWRGFALGTVAVWEYSLTPSQAPTPLQKRAFHQHSSLICWHFCLIQIARTWYSWLRVISGIVLHSVWSLSLWNTMRPTQQLFALAIFFHAEQSHGPVCLLALAKGQRLFSDIIPTIDQTLFTLPWFLSLPAIRRQPSTSCSTEQLYTFISP